MRHPSSIALIPILCLVLLAPSVRGEALDQAHDRFVHGEYESAVTFFEKHLQSAPPTAAAYYGLAQSLHKSDKVVEAALACRRSLLLDPSLVPAAEALTEINAQLGVPSPLPKWQARWAAKVPSDPSVLAGCFSFWLGAFFLLAAFAFSKKRTLFASVGGGLLLLGLAACLLALSTDPRIVDARQAMVMNPEGASLYKVPSEDSAEKITALGQGSVVEVLSARGRWFHIKLSGGQLGWSLQEGITPLIPEA